MTAAPRSRALLVLGMHRSGTSVTTGALHLLGVEMSENLMRAHADNPKGYWEHIEIVELHDELLAALGSRWDDVTPLPTGWESEPRMEPFRARLREIVQRDFGSAAIWALKDPRLCRLLPLWLPLLRELDCEPCCLLVTRDPQSIVRSICRRDGFSESKAELLSLDYLCAAEHDSRACARAFIAYEALLTDPLTALRRVSSALALEWPVSEVSAKAELRNFVDRKLSTARPDAGENAPVHPWLAAAHTALVAAEQEGRDPSTAFDTLWQQLALARSLFVPQIEVQASDLRQQVADLSALAEGAQSTRRQLHELHLEHTSVRADRNSRAERLKTAKKELAMRKVEVKQLRTELKTIRRSFGWKLARLFGTRRKP